MENKDKKDIKSQIEFTTDDGRAERDPSLDIEPEMEIYVTNMEDGKALVNVDMAMVNHAPIPRLHWLFGIQIELNDPDEDGFYSKEEEPKIAEMHEHIVEVMQNDGRCRFVGAVTYAGMRMMYFYGVDENYLPPLVGKLAAEYSDYDFNFMTENDGKWDFYFNALYPDEQTMAIIRNRYMIQNLIDSGVDIHHDYSVFYFFFFPDGASRAQAAGQLQMQGFEIVDDHLYAEEMEPMSMGLQVLAHHNLELMTVTEKTYQCFELMEQFPGIFDGWELAPAEDIADSRDKWI